MFRSEACNATLVTRCYITRLCPVIFCIVRQELRWQIGAVDIDMSVFYLLVALPTSVNIAGRMEIDLGVSRLIIKGHIS
jgi:hypothetical protein